MEKNSIKFWIATVALALSACSSDRHEQTLENLKTEASSSKRYEEGTRQGYGSETTEEAPEEAKDYGEIVGLSLSRNASADTSKKFLKTSDLHFETKDVFESTQNIENVAFEAGGYVQSSDISGIGRFYHREKTLGDSVKIVRKVSSRSEITLRIPTDKLHGVMQKIAKEVVFLNSRVIKIEDVTLQILENQLEQNRNKRFNERVQGVVHAAKAKTEEQLAIFESMRDKEAQIDYALLEEKNELNRIQFASIKLALYETPHFETHYEKIYKEQSSFAVLMKDAWENGVVIVRSIAYILVTIWPLLITALLFLIVLKLYKRSR